MTEFDLKKFIPSHVSQAKGYQAKDPVPPGPDVFKMDLNECLAAPSPKVLAALREALSKEAMLNWYPDSHCGALRAAIGKYLGIPATHSLVTNGSNMAMEIFARTLLAEGDPVLIVSPVYDVFEMQCQLQRTKTEHFYFREPFAPEFSELIDHPGSYKVIYLANPNNPTGIGYPLEAIQALLEKRRDSLVVLDEAYHEFYGVTAVSLLARYPNLILLRSFSKAFSLAGMRCGYLVAQPEVLTVVHKALSPWPVNGLTQIAATAALSDLETMRNFVRECASARRVIVEGLQRLGFEARDTHANFILWKVPNPAKAVPLLAGHQVFVSNKDGVRQLKGYLRVTVGDTEHARRFVRLVTELKEPLLQA